MKILLADSDEEVRYFLHKYFSRRNIDCITTDSGRRVLRHLRKLHFDVVIMALNLRELHGLEVIKNIKDLEIRKKIFVVSGNVDTLTTAECLIHDIADYLMKPVLANDLEKLVINHTFNISDDD